MKKSIVALLLAGMCSAPAVASAAMNPYVSANVGIGIMGDSDVSVLGISVDNAISYKTGVPFGVAVGAKFDSFRAEAALGFQSNDIDEVLNVPISDTKVDMLTYMANCYYDIAIENSPFTPYVMGGIGGAHVTFKDTTDDLSQSVFAWQLGLGVSVNVAEQFDVDLGFRYLNPSDFSDSGADISLQSSNILAGVRYSF